MQMFLLLQMRSFLTTSLKQNQEIVTRLLGRMNFKFVDINLYRIIWSTMRQSQYETQQKHFIGQNRFLIICQVVHQTQH